MKVKQTIKDTIWVDSVLNLPEDGMKCVPIPIRVLIKNQADIDHSELSKIWSRVQLGELPEEIPTEEPKEVDPKQVGPAHAQIINEAVRKQKLKEEAFKEMLEDYVLGWDISINGEAVEFTKSELQDAITVRFWFVALSSAINTYVAGKYKAIEKN